MTKKENQYLLNVIDNEGFDYAFAGYSHFEDIKDKTFHKLRMAYLAAREALAEYVGAEE